MQISKSFPFLSIAKHYGASYDVVLILADQQLHDRHSNGDVSPCRVMSKEWLHASWKAEPTLHMEIADAAAVIKAEWAK